MAELLPTLAARDIRQSLSNYLATTFALTDPGANDALKEFLEHPEHGIFRGPFLRIRMPFGPAASGWEEHLDISPQFPPYGHQARAFERLTSKDHTPQPTLVTTGTGSGKTEAFLYPILDHVRRMKALGQTGVKALILYPMNALANDQASRITQLVSQIDGLAGVTVGLYTGQAKDAAASIAGTALITDRHQIRDTPPDILLTNYKMLDQLLLRPEDQKLWETSAFSLQYLVLDEFHTYDGAQGTDVAMLLRRLGLAIKSYWPTSPAAAAGRGLAEDQWLSDDVKRLPLGKVTPVATSATLGDKGDPAQMLSFARTVFGVEFDPDAVITESRVPLDQWRAAGTHVVVLGAEGSSGSNYHASPLAPASVDVRSLHAAVTAYLADGSHEPAEHAAGVTARVLAHLFTLTAPTGQSVTGQDAISVFEQVTATDLLALERALPAVGSLIEASTQAAPLRELAHLMFPDKPAPLRNPVTLSATSRAESGVSDYIADPREHAFEYVIAALSHIRAVAGRDALTIELHMWVRELSRINRRVSLRPSFTWADDGIVHAAQDDDHTGYTLPALYCRHCGRSGWQILLTPTGLDLDSHDEAIRKEYASRNNRVRPLLHARGESFSALEGTPVPGLHWFDSELRTLTTTTPSQDELDTVENTLLPVLTYTDIDANDKALAGVCPNCERTDGIRPLGSRIATLLSVTLSTMFGDQFVDAGEKKALVFTDSVQDAAHRAGFVQARSHALTLRAALAGAVMNADAGGLDDTEALDGAGADSAGAGVDAGSGVGSVSLPDLVDRAMAHAAASGQHERYRLVPPDYAERDGFKGYWEVADASKIKRSDYTMVQRRLLFDAQLEFGVQHTLGRTLELTGTLAAWVQVPSHVDLDAVARTALEGYSKSSTLEQVVDADVDAPVFSADQVRAWLTGVLYRMRSEGAIYHPWLDKYIAEDGRRIWIWGKRSKGEGMPAFPKGRPGFGFPRVGPALGGKTSGGKTSGGKADSDFTQVNSPQSWYATWTARVLSMEAYSAANLAAKLFRELAKAGVVTQYTSSSGAYIYALQPHQIAIANIADDQLNAAHHFGQCSVCNAVITGNVDTIAALVGAPCMLPRCTGIFESQVVKTNFYRRLYRSADMRRIVAREHTSLLQDAERLEYENGFKASSQSAGAPNVLVATPTLEMGIDIGDLSSVLLSSMPHTVASYIQRVGRAGRQTGNALDLAFVQGRGADLAKIEQPLTVINGAVRAPATYLAADEILRRQYLASVVDKIARSGAVKMPRNAHKVFAPSGASASGSVGAGVAGVRSGAGAAVGVGAAHKLPFLDVLVTYAQDNADELVGDFLGQFASSGVRHFDSAARALALWAGSSVENSQTGSVLAENSPVENNLIENNLIENNQVENGTAENGSADGGEDQPHSTLAQDVYGAAQRWTAQRDAITYRIKAIDEAFEDAQKRANVPNASEDDVVAFKSLEGEKRMLLCKRADMHKQYWINALEEFGLLPNYTLLDDTVDLDVSLRWRNPLTADYEIEEMTLHRWASVAIREFVPGAKFYARGYRTEIQSIDLGANASEVTEQAFCDACGYSETIVASKPRSMTCPRCGSAGIADMGQVLKVVELRKVSSEISRDESAISDSTDDREKPYFTVRTLADIDTSPGNVAAQWYITDHEFGVRYLRRVTLKQLNLGVSRTTGAEMMLSGFAERTPLFAVCEYCGKRDSGTNNNTARDHRAWCIHRKDTEEHNLHIAISRTLHTQGLVLRLPAAYTLGDDTAVPSLSAALFLGLREHIGGEPDHLGLEEVVDPVGGDPNKNRRALLLHDLVPGGTGYLADLADPDQLRSILLKAYAVISTCDCDPMVTMACANCLLPHAALGHMNQISRATAEKLLRELLNLTTTQDASEEPDPDAHWRVTQELTVMNVGESHLEKQFREAFSTMITSRGGKLSVSHTPGGQQLNFSLANSTVSWKLRPQVPLGFTQPDFVLEANNPHLPSVAIYLDGYTFHGTTAHQDLAGDAHKRNTLRDMGYVVLSLTAKDLSEPGGYAPAWFQGALLNQTSSLLGVAAESDVHAVIDQGVLAILWYYLTKESVSSLAGAATVGAFMWAMSAGSSSMAAGLGEGSLERLAALLGTSDAAAVDFVDATRQSGWVPGPFTVCGYRAEGNLYLSQTLVGATGDSHGGGARIRMKMLVVHDDSPAALHAVTHKDTWQAWLRTANILAWGDQPFTMATTSMLSDLAHSEPVLHEESAIEQQWLLSDPTLAPDEREMLTELARIVGNHGGIADAIQTDLHVGDESDQGFVMDLSWPTYKIAVLLDPEEDDITELTADGWTVFGAEPTQLADALIAAIERNGVNA